MKILSIGDLKSGCWMARIKRPLEQLAKLGHEVYFTDGSVAIPTDGWDIVLFNNLIGNTDLMEGEEMQRIASTEEMLNAFKDGGAKIVYDTDDAQDIIPEHTLNKRLWVKDVLKSFEILLKNADLITTTTPTLAEYLRTKTDRPIKVLPNCMDISEFTEREHFDRLRIGMAGSVSHIKDILIPLDAIRELQKKYDFQFFIFGFSKLSLDKFIQRCENEKAVKILKELKKKLKGLDYCWLPPVKTNEYAERLSRLGFDIGICPLEDTQFNQKKSCIKFYEYSLVGTCVIASDVLPYKGELKDEWLAGDWYSKLEELILNKDLREQRQREQKEWVLDHRDISKEVKQWKKEYLSTLR